jgi:hypothetical protein
MVTATIQHSPQQELVGDMPDGERAVRHYRSARDTDETSYASAEDRRVDAARLQESPRCRATIRMSAPGEAGGFQPVKVRPG